MRNNIIVNCESQLQHLLFHSFIFFFIKSVTIVCYASFIISAAVYQNVLQLSYLNDHCESSKYKHWQPLFVGLEVDWFEFHFSSFSGVVISLPVIPVNTVSKWRVSSAVIEAVQVGVMAVLVPPGPLVTCSTATRSAIIVSIFSGERVASVTS